MSKNKIKLLFKIFNILFKVKKIKKDLQKEKEKKKEKEKEQFTKIIYTYITQKYFFRKKISNTVLFVTILNYKD
jgi:hypothetical protein